MRETAFRPTVQIGPSACLLLRPRWPVVPIMLAPGNGFRLRAVSRQAKPVTVLHLELRPKPHEKHQRKQFLPVGITPLSAPFEERDDPSQKKEKQTMKTNRHSHPEQQNEASQGPKIPPEIREALQHILNYLWADEENDYLGTSRADRSQHIFVALRKIDNWL